MGSGSRMRGPTLPDWRARAQRPRSACVCLCLAALPNGRLLPSIHQSTSARPQVAAVKKLETMTQTGGREGEG